MCPIGIAQLEAAINRARAARPTWRGEPALSLEVTILAGLYGRMIYEGRDRIDESELTDAEKLALALWAVR